jgi:hypothetical protein
MTRSFLRRRQLYGKGDGARTEYFVSLDGSGAPSSTTLQVDESRVEDERSFTGLYGQAIWTPAPRWRIDVSLRPDVTSEGAKERWTRRPDVTATDS